MKVQTFTNFGTCLLLFISFNLFLISKYKIKKRKPTIKLIGEQETISLEVQELFH